MINETDKQIITRTINNINAMDTIEIIWNTYMNSNSYDE